LIRIHSTGVGRYLVGPAPNPGQEGGGVEAGTCPPLFLLVFLVKALPITEKSVMIFFVLPNSGLAFQSPSLMKNKLIVNR
jgi:hypothetical protein